MKTMYGILTQEALDASKILGAHQITYENFSFKPNTELHFGVDKNKETDALDMSLVIAHDDYEHVFTVAFEQSIPVHLIPAVCVPLNLLFEHGNSFNDALFDTLSAAFVSFVELTICQDASTSEVSFTIELGDFVATKSKSMSELEAYL